METFEDFEFIQFDQDSDEESLWEFINISDSDAPHLIDISDSPIVSPPTTARPSRRRQTRILLDIPLHSGKPCDDVSGDDENEEQEEEEDDVDDELVPWWVRDKVGRERMRKLGKRTFTKMLSSKKCPYMVVRPGCVRGKHGLGLKHIPH